MKYTDKAENDTNENSDKSGNFLQRWDQMRKIYNDKFNFFNIDFCKNWQIL